LDQVNVSIHVPSGLAAKIQAAKIALLSGDIKRTWKKLLNSQKVILDFFHLGSASANRQPQNKS
jgi:hypothetical protein